MNFSKAKNIYRNFSYGTIAWSNFQFESIDITQTPKIDIYFRHYLNKSMYK